MAQGAMSDEITRHFQAALALSRRDLLRRLLSEAELCLELNQANVAAILAGIALEELSSSSDLNVDQTRDPRLKAWRELRNRTEHSTAFEQEPDQQTVAAMVISIRAFLDQIDRSHATPEAPRLLRTRL